MQSLLTASPSLRHKRIRQFIFGGQAIQAFALTVLGLLHLIDYLDFEIPNWLSGPLIVMSYGLLIPGFIAYWLFLRISFSLAIFGFVIINTLFYGILGFIVANKTFPKSKHYCIKCEYDLTGNESGICPECGTPTALDK